MSSLKVIVDRRRELFELMVPEPAGGEGSFRTGGEGRTLMVELGCKRFGCTCPSEVLAALMCQILLAGAGDRLENRGSLCLFDRRTVELDDVLSPRPQPAAPKRESPEEL